VHAAASNHLDYIEKLLPVGEGVEYRGHGAHVGDKGAQPDKMAGDAKQFRQHDPDIYRPVGDHDSAQSLDAVDIGQVVLDPGQIVDPVGIGYKLIPVLAFGDLFSPAVMESDIEIDISDLLTIQLENTANDSMGPGVLRSQIQQQFAFADSFEEVIGRQGSMSSGIIYPIRFHLGGPERVLFTQGMPLPVVWHENPSKIGVAAETDAKHIKDFPLVPIGRRIHAGDTGNFRVVSCQLRLDAQIAGLVKGKQVIVECEIRV